MLIGTKLDSSRISERFNCSRNGFCIVVQLGEIKEHNSDAAVRHNSKPHCVGGNIAVHAGGPDNVGSNVAGTVPTRPTVATTVAARRFAR